jgi:hypothetical protein
MDLRKKVVMFKTARPMPLPHGVAFPGIGLNAVVWHAIISLVIEVYAQPSFPRDPEYQYL